MKRFYSFAAMGDRISPCQQYFSVQPCIMVLLFCKVMIGTVLQDFIVYRACMEIMNKNSTECLVLHTNSSSQEAFLIKKKVQLEVSSIIMAQSFIDGIVPSLLSLFLGPWSDKYGRKPLLILGYLGSCLSSILLPILSTLDINPWLILIYLIPNGLCGGFCIIMMTTMCYVCDVTEEQSRTWHLAWLQSLIFVGILIGTFTGPAIFDNFGYIATFATSSIFQIFTFLYVIILVPETIQTNSVRTWGNIFDLSLVKDLIDACVKKRIGFNRKIVWCCILALAINILIMDGEIAIGFLFASARFGWDVDTYSIYSGTSMVLAIIGTIFGIRVIKPYIGLPETIISLLFVISSIGSAMTKAFALKSWHMYLAQTISIFSGGFPPILRSVLSKSIPVQDAGKVFSLTAIIETILPVGASSLFGMIFSYTMPPLYPSPVWFVSATCHVIIIILLLYIHSQVTKCNNVRYAPLDQNCEQSD